MTFEEFTEKYAGKRYEYFDGRAVPMGPEASGEDGEVYAAPTKGIHGLLAMESGSLVRNHVREKKLGMVFGAETGFLLRQEPPIMRAADIAFIARERLPGIDLSDWLPVPDLAVEVISEHDLAKEIHRKVQQCLNAGVRLVWVVYPEDRQVVVYRPGEAAVTLGVGDTLDGGDVLSGFSVTLAALFAILDHEA
jgi:Uma2 family endonuclease